MSDCKTKTNNKIIIKIRCYVQRISQNTLSVVRLENKPNEIRSVDRSRKWWVLERGSNLEIRINYETSIEIYETAVKLTNCNIWL